MNHYFNTLSLFLFLSKTYFKFYYTRMSISIILFIKLSDMNISWKITRIWN